MRNKDLRNPSWLFKDVRGFSPVPFIDSTLDHQDFVPGLYIFRQYCRLFAGGPGLIFPCVLFLRLLRSYNHSGLIRPSRWSETGSTLYGSMFNVTDVWGPTTFPFDMGPPTPAITPSVSFLMFLWHQRLLQKETPVFRCRSVCKRTEPLFVPFLSLL